MVQYLQLLPIHYAHSRSRVDPRASSKRSPYIALLYESLYDTLFTCKIHYRLHAFLGVITEMDPSIARAVFTSALLRADADAHEVRREDAALFIKALLRTVNLCTSREIKVRMGWEYSQIGRKALELPLDERRRS